MNEVTKVINVRLNEREYDRLCYFSEKCGMQKSNYIRYMINGTTPKEQPPAEYFEMLKEFFSTASNLNRLISKFKELYDIDPTLFFENYRLFIKTLDKIQDTVQQYHDMEYTTAAYERAWFMANFDDRNP